MSAFVYIGNENVWVDMDLETALSMPPDELRQIRDIIERVGSSGTGGRSDEYWNRFLGQSDE